MSELMGLVEAMGYQVTQIAIGRGLLGQVLLTLKAVKGGHLRAGSALGPTVDAAAANLAARVQEEW